MKCAICGASPGEWHTGICQYGGKFESSDIVRVPDYDAIRDLDHGLKRFNDAMRYKLLKNAHKGRWEDLPLADALAKLKAEVAELEAAIEQGNTVEILLEAADVANFAMITASIAVERGN